MEAFASYLLKSALWLSGFAVIYFLFLRNERYFMLKRIYLICGMLIAFLFPVISVHYNVELQATGQPTALELSNAAGNIVTTGVQQGNAFHIDYKVIILFFYLTGIIYLLLRAIGNFTGIFRAIRGSEVTDRGKIRIIKATQFRSSFSFFNYVFINPSIGEEEAAEIMNHEIVHVRQRHWFDLLLVEILRMVQWVNPFAWIYTGFIRLNHEYLADQAALQRSVSPANYRAALMNQLFDSPVISLSNSFNYSLNKKRFDMMKQKVTSPWRKTKVLFILPVIALLLYAFATPRYISAKAPAEKENTILAASINKTNVSGTLIQQDTSKHKKPQKPPMKALSTPTPPPPPPPPPPAQPRKEEVPNEPRTITVYDHGPESAIFFNGELSDKPAPEIIKNLGHEMGTMRPLSPAEGLKKYGEKGKNGGYEILTRKQAIEMGIHPPYPRIGREDFPTFIGDSYASFTDWVLKQLKYPPEAAARGIKGRVSVVLEIDSVGAVTNVREQGHSDPLLSNPVVSVIKSSPKWEPAKNPEAAREPFPVMVELKFTLPDKIEQSDVFVIVENMPQYPGGEGALLQFIKDNTKYPEAAKNQNVQGRVIIRFVINKEGNAEDVIILKGVNPLLDEEAVRVIGLLKGFKPGMQGGRAVDTYYMVPVTFSLTEPKPVFSGTSENEILKFLAQKTGYPQESRNAADTGNIYILVRMDKGGILKETRRLENITSTSVSVLKQVVIVGYKGNSNPGLQGPPVPSANHKLLYDEAVRVAKLLPGLDLPEWKDKPVDFILQLKFILK